MKSHFEKEKSLDTEKEVQELKRKLREMDEERSFILRQRDHFVEEKLLIERTKNTSSKLSASSDQQNEFSTGARTPRPLAKFLDSLAESSSFPSNTNPSFSRQYPERKALRSELPTRDNMSFVSTNDGSKAKQYLNEGYHDSEDVFNRLHQQGLITNGTATSQGVSRKVKRHIPGTGAKGLYPDTSNQRHQTKPVKLNQRSDLWDVSTARLPSRDGRSFEKDASLVEQKKILKGGGTLTVSAKVTEGLKSSVTKLRPVKGLGSSSSKMTLSDLATEQGSYSAEQERTRTPSRKDERDSGKD